MQTGKIILLLLLHVCAGVVFGQKAFSYKDDFKKVLARTKSETDSFSYNRLIKRYAVNDTSLTPAEVLALLIGFTDNRNYNPYKDVVTEREVYNLNRNKQFEAGRDSARQFLSTHPFSIRVLFEIAYSFHKLEEADSALFYVHQAQKILRAMYYSGSGKSAEEPTFALGPLDGQDYIVKFIGAKVGKMGLGRDKHKNFLDILDAKFDDGQIVRLYFVIQHATNKMYVDDDLKRKGNVMTRSGGKNRKDK